MNAACKDCKDRELGCHSVCDKYRAFKEHRKMINEERAKERRIEEVSHTLSGITHMRANVKHKWYY